MLGVSRGFLTASVAENERNHGHDQEDHEKDLGDAGSPSGNTAKPENRRDQRNDKKNNGVMQHSELLYPLGPRRR